MDDGVSAAGIGFLVSGLVSPSGLGGRVVLLLIFRLRLPRIVPVDSGAVFSTVVKTEAAVARWRRGTVDWWLAAPLLPQYRSVIATAWGATSAYRVALLSFDTGIFAYPNILVFALSGMILPRANGRAGFVPVSACASRVPAFV